MFSRFASLITIPSTHHHHDLETALPVDGVIEGVTKFVEESSGLHLLKVDGGKHETKEKVEGLLDDDVLGLEPRSLVGAVEDETVNDHEHTSAEGNSRSSDGYEPVREHQKDPEGEVKKTDRNSSEGAVGREDE